MNIIVVGCGRVGAELAYRLFTKGHKVTVIDHFQSAFNNLDPEFRGRTVEGEALNLDVLRRAGIETADGLAAVTNHDTLNVVVAHIARQVYEIHNVVVRNYDTDFRSLLEVFGVQIVASSSWGAQRVEELLYQTEVEAVFSAGNGEIKIYEFVVPQEWQGHLVRDLFNGGEYVLAAITRAGQAALPTPEFKLHAGDTLLISTTHSGAENFRRRLYERQEASS